MRNTPVHVPTILTLTSRCADGHVGGSEVDKSRSLFWLKRLARQLGGYHWKISNLRLRESWCGEKPRIVALNRQDPNPTTSLSTLTSKPYSIPFEHFHRTKISLSRWVLDTEANASFHACRERRTHAHSLSLLCSLDFHYGNILVDDGYDAVNVDDRGSARQIFLTHMLS